MMTAGASIADSDRRIVYARATSFFDDDVDELLSSARFDETRARFSCFGISSFSSSSNN